MHLSPPVAKAAVCSKAVVLLLLTFFIIVTTIAGVCNCSIFCCTLLFVHSSIAIILMKKRGLVAFLNLAPLCLVMVEWLFLAVPWGCLRFVIVVFPDHTHLLFSYCVRKSIPQFGAEYVNDLSNTDDRDLGTANVPLTDDLRV